MHETAVQAVRPSQDFINPDLIAGRETTPPTDTLDRDAERAHAARKYTARGMPSGPQRVEQDAALFNRTVRAAATTVPGFRMTPEQEAEQKYRLFTNRGLKVKPGYEAHYNPDTHTLYHPTPEDHAAVVKTYLSHAPTGTKVRLARHKDLQRHAAFWAHLNAVADNHDHVAEKNGMIYPVTRHDVAGHAALADHIGELVGNDQDPRAEIVRDTAPTDYHAWKHTTSPSARWSLFGLAQRGPYGVVHGGLASPEAYRINAHTGMQLRRAISVSTSPPSERPAVNWRIHIPRTRSSTGKSRVAEFTKIFRDANELHDFIDRLPKQNRMDWAHTARLAGFERTDGKPHANDMTIHVKLARTRVDNTGSAQAVTGSTNHAARLAVVRQTLRESGLVPSTVRAALAHDGQKVTPAFAGVVKRSAHPDHLLYTAAWAGLLSGQQRLAVVHPDPEGDDFLHVISAPLPPDSISAALRGAGVQKFTTEKTGNGTRAFVLNPNGRFDLARVAGAIPNASHSSARVRVYRIGAGQSSDADARGDASSRRGYRDVIDKFERDAGAGPAAGNTSAPQAA